jgi:hypothetical protein
MKLLCTASISVLVLMTSAFAQTASLTADQTALAPAGGTIALTATVNYEGEPGAVGWSIALPAEWSLMSVAGPNVPAIKPEAGSTGTLEFAYTNVPANRAEFSVMVRYPANATTAVARPTVIVRAGGKLNTLTPPAVELRAGATSGQRARN